MMSFGCRGGLTRCTRPAVVLAVFSALIGPASLVTGCAATSAMAPTAKEIISCDPATGGSIPAGAEWEPFSAFVDECLVHSPGGNLALSIISVSAERFYRDKPSGTEIVNFPKPIIRSTGGRVIGRLPHSYPDDPPVSIRLSFGEWKDDFPQRIEIFVEDPTVSGNHVLPALIWDRDKDRFESTPG